MSAVSARLVSVEPTSAWDIRRIFPGRSPRCRVLTVGGDRRVAFEVNDLQAPIDRPATEGYGPVGGIGDYEGALRMAYVPGPAGTIDSLAERIG
jgi:hypothetical protein